MGNTNDNMTSSPPIYHNISVVADAAFVMSNHPSYKNVIQQKKIKDFLIRRMQQQIRELKKNDEIKNEGGSTA